MGLMSDRRFTVVVTAIVTLLVVLLGIVAGLTLANRPVSNVLELSALTIAPTIASLVGLAVAKDTNYTIKNGLRDEIVQRTAARTAELVQGTSVPGGLRASDPPATILPTPPPSTGEAP